MHQRLRDRTLTKDHELDGEAIWIRNFKLDQKFAKQSAALFFVGDGDLVGCMCWIGQFGNGVHEWTPAISVAPHRALKSIEIVEDLLGWRQAGFLNRPQAAR